MKYKFTAIKFRPKGSKNWYKFKFSKGNGKYLLKNLKGGI